MSIAADAEDTDNLFSCFTDRVAQHKEEIGDVFNVNLKQLSGLKKTTGFKKKLKLQN